MTARGHVRAPPARARARRRARPSSARSDGLAADVPDRALRPDRVRVGERPDDAHLARHAGCVDSFETASYHAGRCAVAECVRDAELERGRPARVQRIERAELQRGDVDVIARREPKVAEQVAPVGGEQGDRGVPVGRQRRPGVVGRDDQVARRDELEGARDALGVDSAQKSSNRFGSDTRAGAHELEAEGPAGPSWAGRSEQRSGALAAGRVVHREDELCVAPPRIQAAFDGFPLVDERHRTHHKLRAVAKVEAKTSLAKSDLADVLREMLLIRRFEEKVEERFRAGDLPGFLHVTIGEEGCAVGVCRALEDGDVIASTHRAHGHTLAKGTHPNELMAELYGKQEGCSHGYGGSMELYARGRGDLWADARSRGAPPPNTGAAPAFPLRREPRGAGPVFGGRGTNNGPVP